MTKVLNRALKLGGETLNIGGTLVTVLEFNANDQVTRATGTTVPTAASAGFALNCRFIHTDGVAGETEYVNEGTATSCLFIPLKSFAPGNVAVTANDDGTGTAIIPTHAKFVTVTSAGATKVVALPAASAATIGREINIYVGSNGYELITSQTNDTINTVDSDGTNQLDVAANTLLRVVQVSATGFVAYQVAATTITVVAPDND